MGQTLRENIMMHIKSLHIYPIKGFPALDVTSADIEPQGLRHDRRFMLVDETGKFLTQREYIAKNMAALRPRLVDNGIAVSDGTDEIIIPYPSDDAPQTDIKIWKHNGPALCTPPHVDDWFKKRIGITCRLVYQGNILRPTSKDWSRAGDHVSFADGFPLLITNTASLDDLNAKMSSPLPMDRFRPNIVIETQAPWDEDTWKMLEIGGVAIDISKPCTRCIVTTLDQTTGIKTGGEPLDTLKAHRMIRTPALAGVIFGQNAIPRGTGTIRIGDDVSVLQTQNAPVFANKP